jgi:diguanylate cyclase (GGDEF)-like protein
LLNPIAIADLMDRRATRPEVLSGVAFVAVFATLTLVAVRFGDVSGPVLSPFVPICATLWGIADLLTAYLLLNQFNVNGVRAFAILGAAYAFPGLLTIPYVAFFPGLFLMPPLTIGVQQISMWLWLTWHFAFPFFVAGYHLVDRNLSKRITSGLGVRRWSVGVALMSVIACAAVAALIVGERDHLPIGIVNGTFTEFYRTIATPIFVAANLLAAVVLVIASKRRPSTLQVWLSVALITAALDGTLNAFSNGRYTVSWYVGKVETLATATVVLAVLLSEVTALYRRLGSLATIDALTGLANRQSFDDAARFTLQLYRRGSAALAFLVIDIDYFKQYNDTYGHHGGDMCLRRVAECVRNTCGRSVDIVGRFGGEEFVVLLPGTNAIGAMRVAESIRCCVEALGIAHAGSSVSGFVTVSIGGAEVSYEHDAQLETLFQRADAAALYRAKVTRNAIAMAEASTDEPPERMRSFLAPENIPQRA